MKQNFALPLSIAAELPSCPLDSYRALLVIGLTRDRIECALRYLIGVCFHIVERHKNLAGSDDFGHAQLHTAHPAARGDHVHLIMGPQLQFPGVFWIHLQPGIRRHSLEDRHLARLGTCMPMLHRAPGIQDKGELPVWLFGKWFPLHAEKLRLAIVCLKMSIAIEACALHFRTACSIGPLNSTVFLDSLIAHAGVIA